jgi:malate synthase
LDLLYFHADTPAPSQVKADKQREVRDGHDGTWVAHPALVGVALDIFNAGMRTPNQVQSQSEASA